MTIYNNNQDDNTFSHDVRKYIRHLENSFAQERVQKLYCTIIGRVERTVIEAALERTFGNQLKAAKILGINRNTLRTKIKKLGINIEKWKL